MDFQNRMQGSQAVMTDDLDQLPIEGISEYVESFAWAHGVVYQRTRLDDWAAAVTRAAGDEVRLDHTEKLLVALKKRHLIDGRQAARLLTNYMNEAQRVRPGS